jgi:hypothetical protein
LEFHETHLESIPHIGQILLAKVGMASETTHDDIDHAKKAIRLKRYLC